MSLSDLDARDKALCIKTSSIIEAGAGAGKTSLMVQRYFALLAVSDSPEQVLFCTFTRAATQEMQLRVMDALYAAKTSPRPDTEYEKKTYDLAKQVIERDEKLDWGLLHNSARMNILTLDGLAAKVAKQMPILSGMGGDISVIEDPFSLYSAAGMAVLEAVEDDGEISQDVERLMLHMDGNHQRAVELISQMMAKRDQWLRHVLHGKNGLNKDSVEDVLASVIDSVKSHAAETIANISKDIDQLIAFAQKNVGPDHIFLHYDDKDKYFHCIAELFLTAKGTLRKSVTKAHGFPAGKDNAEMKDLWKSVASELTSDAINAIGLVRKLPVPEYDEQQWQLLNSLFRVLLRSAVELKLVFNREGKVDFTEVSSRAIAGLSPDNDDRTVAHRLFSLFRHIIIDEVQDINRTQYKIIESLISEWDGTMGNTICLVGDPKQSIYRFREADVGLFLQAQERGIGQIDLVPLNLTTNFRSSPEIVDFNNSVYQNIFPNSVDIAKGAMPYSPSQSAKSGTSLDGIETWCLSEPSDDGEALLISEAILESKAIAPESSIVVLVRSRSHLRSVASQLRSDGIPFQAVEIENIAQKQAVQDVLSLTKAVLHPMDSIAWLSLLRSPALGMSLDDLTALFESLGDESIIERLFDKDRLQSLTENGKSAVSLLRKTIKWLIANQSSFDQITLIKAVWHQVGFAKGYSENEIDDVHSFFSLLEDYREDGIDIVDIERRLERFYAKPDPRPEAALVQLMTLHKSKGLEFDVVIIPCLGSKGHRQDPSLVMWHEFTDEDSGLPKMLIAPIKGQEENDIYQFMMDIEKEKSDLELIRLLYVGTTRAKNRLYLIGTVINEKPTSSSLFSPIWPYLNPQYKDQCNEAEKDASLDDEASTDEELPLTLVDTTLVRVEQ